MQQQYKHCPKCFSKRIDGDRERGEFCYWCETPISAFVVDVVHEEKPLVAFAVCAPALSGLSIYVAACSADGAYRYWVSHLESQNDKVVWDDPRCWTVRRFPQLDVDAAECEEITRIHGLTAV